MNLKKDKQERIDKIIHQLTKAFLQTLDDFFRDNNMIFCRC